MIKCLVFESLKNICPTKNTNNLLYQLEYIYCGCNVGTLCFLSHAFFLYFIHMQKFSTNLCVVFGENCIAGMSVAWGRGVHAPLFLQVLAGQLTLSQLRGQIMPTNYYKPSPHPPQIFRPSDMPTLDATNACMQQYIKRFLKSFDSQLAFKSHQQHLFLNS